MKVDQPDCGCIVAAETQVVVFARDDCTTGHVAGSALTDDPQYAEWITLGEPVG